MLKFLCLGSGSSGNSYYLWNEEGGILIDAGLTLKSIRRYFQTFSLPMTHIKAVFITHDHADHIKAVGRLAAEMGLPIYATERVHEGIARNYCVTPRLQAAAKHFIVKDEPVVIAGITVTAFDVPHDSNDCCGFSFVSQGVRFCLITDVGHVTERIKDEVAKANYLVLESNHDREMLMAGPYPAYLKGRISGPHGHLSNTEAAELLAGSSTPELRHVWLCHLSEENNHPELARKTVETVLRSYGIVCGVDFQLDVLKRRMPSEVYDFVP